MIKKNLIFPLIVIIEETNDCNLKCVMCPRTKMSREVGYMDFGLYKKIIDECCEYKVSILALHIFGEPLMHQSLCKMIKYAKSRGIRHVSLSTNATLLNETKSKEILDSGLDVMTISLDGSRKETYEKLRKGSNFDSVTNNIKKFLTLEKELGLKKPLVKLQIIRMKETEHEIELFEKHWYSSANDIQVVAYDTFAGQVEDRSVKADRYIRRRVPCRALWDQIAIYWDGNVPICCHDVEGNMLMGNVQHKSIKDVWNNQKFEKVRQRHIDEEYSKLQLCADCKEWWRYSESVWYWWK